MHHDGVNDPLMEAILAAPDDDAPRLVWADREGGERGELVVIQCALAGHALSREERERLAAREAALLKKNSQAWAGAPHATFRRGFVERMRMDVDRLVPRVEELFATLPLLRALRIERIAEDTNAYAGPDPEASWLEGAQKLEDILGRVPPGRLVALDVSAHVYQTGDWSDPGSTHHFDAHLLELLGRNASVLTALRELVMINTGVEAHHVPRLASLALERLQLGSHRLGAAGVISLLQQAPSIVRLAVWAGTPRLCGRELTTLLEAPEIARLKELDLLSNSLAAGDLERIASCAALSNLERLGVGYAHAAGVGYLARSPHLARLRELDLYGIRDADLALVDPTFAASLRVLRLPVDKRGVQLPQLTALERIDASG